MRARWPLSAALVMPLALVACDIYEDVEPPSEFAAAAAADLAAPDPVAVAPKSDANGIVTYALDAEAETPLRVEGSASGAAKGVRLDIPAGALPKDVEVVIEPAVKLPLKQLRTEVGSPAEISEFGASVHVGVTPQLEATEPFTVTMPFDPLAEPTLAPAGSGTCPCPSILVLGFDADSSETHVMLLAPGDFKSDEEAKTISFRTKRFGIYAIVTVGDVEDSFNERLDRRTSRKPANYGISSIKPKLKLSGLPGSNVKKKSAVAKDDAEADDDDEVQTLEAPAAADVELKVKVGGDGVKEYRYALRHDMTSCTDAEYSKYQDVKTKIKERLGENGVKILCVQGRDSKKRESEVEAYVWRKTTTGVALGVDGDTPVTLSTTESTTLTLKVTGDALVYDIEVAETPDFADFVGGSFPGTDGTCKAASEDASCTLVLEFTGTAAGQYSGFFRITYYDGADQQTLLVKVAATKS